MLYNDLITLANPLIITDELGFSIHYETDVIDEITEEITNNSIVKMVDGDGDGVITITWDPVHSGIAVDTTDMFGKTIQTVFNKEQFKTMIGILNASLNRVE
jgi:hypothetical protein